MKTLFSLLFDLVVLAIVMGSSWHYGTILRTATDPTEVARAGFQTLVSVMVLCFVVLIIRLDVYLRKDK